MSVEDLFQEIKKEIIESHNLTIKTDNLVKNLSAELRQIQKKQERYERKYIFNSVVAYVIFVVVIFGGLYVAFDAKVGVVRREKETLTSQLQKSRTEADELQKKLAVRAQQEKATERFLRLKKKRQDLDALKVAETLDPNVSPLLARLVTNEAAELRQRLSGAALAAGKILYQKGHLKRALRELARATEIKPPAEVMAKVHLLRGMVLLKQNRSAKGGESFLAAANADPDSSFADKALFLAAGALETSGDVPRALRAYERLLKEHLKSPYLSQARRRVFKLTRSGPKDPPLPPGGVVPESGKEKPKPKPKPKPETTPKVPESSGTEG